MCGFRLKAHAETALCRYLASVRSSAPLSAQVFISRHRFFQGFLLVSLPWIFVFVYIGFNQICHFSRIYFSTLTLTHFIYRFPYSLFIFFLGDSFILIKWLNGQFYLLCFFFLDLQFLVQTYFKTTTIAKEEGHCPESRVVGPVSPILLFIQQIFTWGLQVLGSVLWAGDLEINKTGFWLWGCAQ